jgi:hypothetical protein
LPKYIGGGGSNGITFENSPSAGQFASTRVDKLKTFLLVRDVTDWFWSKHCNNKVRKD